MAERERKLIRSWLVQWAPDVRVHNFTRLGDGVSAHVYGVEYSTSRGRQRAALRLVAAPVNLCLRESMVLNRLQSAGLPVPRCYGVKESAGKGCAMLLDWLPGHPVGRPQDVHTYVEQLAELLVSIHQATLPSGLPKFRTVLNRTLRHAAEMPELAAVLQAIKEYPEVGGEVVLLHGDFWPGNLLFQRKVLTGVVDWSDACTGPAAADVANARMELAWVWGMDAMLQFTELYFAKAPIKASHLAYWDLVASLKPAMRAPYWGLKPATLRRLQESVRQMQDDALLTLGRL